MLLFTFALVSLHLFSARPGEKIISASLLLVSFSHCLSFRFFYLYFVFNFHSMSFSLSGSFLVFFDFSFRVGGGEGIRGPALSNPWAALREIASVVQTLGARYLICH